jgi:hypothetical protein
LECPFGLLWQLLMNRLRKFTEVIDLTREVSRIAYVMGVGNLPPALNYCTWHEDTKFSPGDELLANPELKLVFRKALTEGCGLIE